jgi:membrane protein implicated in regulation of membrane protease activity
MEWYIWIALGIVCMIVEVFSFSFYFFSIGAGAIVAGLFATTIFEDNLPWQLLIFAISTTISFLLMKKFARKIIKNDVPQTNIYALENKTGVVIKEILPNQKGYVKIEGEEWSAVAENPEETIPEHSVIKVVNHEGNKLIVAIHNQ